MEDRGVGAAIAGLLAVELAVCDRTGLGVAVKLAQRVRGWVDAVDVAIAHRSKELAAEGRSESAAEVLTGYGWRSTRETKAVSDRSEVCEQMPGFEAALATGADGRRRRGAGGSQSSERKPVASTIVNSTASASSTATEPT
jgi:hypothetical protein